VSSSEPRWPNTSNTLVAFLLGGEPICERCLTDACGGNEEITTARLAQLKQDVRLVSETDTCWICRAVTIVLCVPVPTRTKRTELLGPDRRQEHTGADRRESA
jgi:hypothetical protein